MIMNILDFNILLIHKIEFTNWNTIYQMQKLQIKTNYKNYDNSISSISVLTSTSALSLECLH